MYGADNFTINTRILAQEFELHAARMLQEAISWLDQNGSQARILAGGTDLLVQMKLGRLSPPKVLYIGRINELKHFQVDGGVTLGALVTFYELERAPVIKEQYAALYEAARAFTGTQIKVMGTVGGNLCNASPAADSAPPLLVFGAQVRLESVRGEREVPLESFFLGPGKTVVEPGEILTQIYLPSPAPHTGSAFLKVGRVGADIAKVNTAVWVMRDRETVVDCKIALGSVAPTPLRARRAESLLRGQVFTLAVAEEAAGLAAQEIAPITDVRSTAEYRRAVARVLVRDALLRAWDRAENGGWS